jgi:hypothetical protein
VEGGRGAGDLVHGDGREVGQTKRRSRATDSAPYLGLWCSGEADRRRRAATGYGGRWWRCLGAWEAGRLGWGGAWRGGEPVRPFYRRGKVVR